MCLITMKDWTVPVIPRIAGSGNSQTGQNYCSGRNYDAMTNAAPYRRALSKEEGTAGN